MWIVERGRRDPIDEEAQGDGQFISLKGIVV
jgi:hypothetical protein